MLSTTIMLAMAFFAGELTWPLASRSIKAVAVVATLAPTLALALVALLGFVTKLPHPPRGR